MATSRRSASELLRTAKLRATPQRVRVLELLGARRRPLSVEELVRAGKRAFDTTTAYRTLEALRQRGIVRRIDIDKDRALYELSGDHHHHAVCVSCGDIRDVSMCISPSLDEKIRTAVRFARIEGHALEFFGVCTSCVGGKKK